MTPGTPVMINIPFGYAWTEAEAEEGNKASQPSGPPLLDNAESNILKDFFDDPNNVDPQFLALPTQGFQNASNVMSDFGPFGWDTSALAAQGDMKSFGASLNQPPHSFNAFTAQSASKDDDLFAHNVLQQGNMPAGLNGRHPNVQIPSQGPMGTQAQTPAQQSTPAQRQSQQGSKAQMSPKDPDRAPPAAFPSTAGDQALRSNGTAGGDPSSILVAGSRVSSTPLNFGSDSGFRNHYAGSASFEAPDKVFKGMIGNLSHVSDTERLIGKEDALASSSGDTSPQVGTSKGKKRDNDGDSTEEDEPGRPSKRRRNRVKDEGEGEDDVDENDPDSARSRKLSRRAPGSPGKRRKSSPGPGKMSRENLTEAQKRSNHIQSEQKRRNLIKQGFEDLTRMVPELRPGGLSKSNMLVEAAKFIRDIRDHNEELKRRIDALKPG